MVARTVLLVMDGPYGSMYFFLSGGDLIAVHMGVESSLEGGWAPTEVRRSVNHPHDAPALSPPPPTHTQL